ncbi:MAG: isochorismatase family cysteine hydrolase [Flavobacteriaceae bacterium]|nr:isochorismatase family cysteine hydrolase [Flavobacteriaceae bacterium]
MAKAIIICDFINEIISNEGKFKGKGYAVFAEQHNTLTNTASAVEKARKLGFSVIYVRVGFSADYKEQPKKSLLFGKADQFQAMKLDTWATSIVDALKVEDTDFIVTKHRVSPFYATSLEVILLNSQITDLYICGCATDLVVSSTARDAHDRDFNVFVLEDCCAAGSVEDHEGALTAIRKIATVGASTELIK